MDVTEEMPDASRLQQAPMTVVRWRTGTIHISENGHTTVCHRAIRHDRARILERDSTTWGTQLSCYNCAHLHPPAGYLPASSSRSFPLKPECPHHPRSGLPEGACSRCDPALLKPQNWPCPNGCTDPADHAFYSRYPRCTVHPPTREPGPDGRCRDGCESTERAIHRANPKLFFDLADSASCLCYHCGQEVCVGCQTRPVDGYMLLCDRCCHWTEPAGHAPAATTTGCC